MKSAPEVAFSYFFFFLIILQMITSQENCPSTRCSNVGPEIAYPFVAKDRQGEGCGYPGFNLTCNTLDKTVLKLPDSGEFLIRVYDQDDCLARRFQLQNLDINLSPFKAFAYQSYNFFNCPPSITSLNKSALPRHEGVLGIQCLSSPTNIVVVTLTSASVSGSNMSQVLLSRGCVIIAPVTIPIPFSAINDIYSYDFTKDDLYLTWAEPTKSTAGNKTEFSVVSEDKPERKESAFNWKKLVTIITPILIAVSIITSIVFFVVRRRSADGKCASMYLLNRKFVTCNYLTVGSCGLNKFPYLLIKKLVNKMK
ncbi:hypothetical protein MKX01_027948 [Papaver californicum]|nr:hypothetical protein MKX01_027948 [Papaver californicum]